MISYTFNATLGRQRQVDLSELEVSLALIECSTPARPVVSYFCLRISIAVKKHHDHSNSYKGKLLIGVAHLQFRSWVHWGKQGSIQTDMVLEKELRVLTSWLTGNSLSIYETSKPASAVTHFLQQGHTHYNKVSHPDSATPFGPFSFKILHGVQPELKDRTGHGTVLFNLLVLNLWVMTPLGIKWPFHRGHLRPSCRPFIYIMIHNSSKSTVMK